MPEEFIEAILIWSQAGPSASVETWLTDQGFEVLEMRAGLLIRGAASRFESAFGVSVDKARRPQELPVPENLKTHVSSIGIPETPRFHG